MSDAGWSEAAAGCEYVLHVASPLPAAGGFTEEEMVMPCCHPLLLCLADTTGLVPWASPPRHMPCRWNQCWRQASGHCECLRVRQTADKTRGGGHAARSAGCQGRRREARRAHVLLRRRRLRCAGIVACTTWVQLIWRRRRRGAVFICCRPLRLSPARACLFPGSCMLCTCGLLRTCIRALHVKLFV